MNSEHVFFTETVCFIREFNVKKEERGKGLGSNILKDLESMMNEQKIVKMFLTTDDEINFYLKRHYQIDSSYKANNDLVCMIKYL